ncbi:MAG: DUF3298 domain-containing protein [Lachnospiraceae bacterium]|nr:DUF3298 domain-containing protein [Lachnospiraceae bacterium]
MKELNERLEEELQERKKEYLKPQMSEAQLAALRKKMEEAKKMDKRNRNKKRMVRLATAAAALAGIFVILPNTSAGIAHAMEQIPVLGQLVEVVTFRDYNYETDRNIADIQVPEVKVADQTGDSQVQENLSRTAEEINAEIQEITDKLIEEFEANLDDEMGYQDILVKSEVLTTTEEYFTLKLICYQGAGSGYQWNVFYTIDLNTGERLALKDLFLEGADYITAISENIKEQMQARMDADENVYYWLNDEIEEWNFKAITDETSFYLNEKGNVVIGFNEGDVAPMYMGTVEFEIPAEVLEGMWK